VVQYRAFLLLRLQRKQGLFHYLQSLMIFSGETTPFVCGVALPPSTDPWWSRRVVFPFSGDEEPFFFPGQRNRTLAPLAPHGTLTCFFGMVFSGSFPIEALRHHWTALQNPPFSFSPSIVTGSAINAFWKSVFFFFRKAAVCLK